MDPGPSTNRTVYTFVGSPSAVVEGALNMARVAAKLIDMRGHHGKKAFKVIKKGCLFDCAILFVFISGLKKWVGNEKIIMSNYANHLIYIL